MPFPRNTFAVVTCEVLMRRVCLLLLLLASLSAWCADDVDSLTAVVTRMARIGHCSSPQFSPDGKTVAFISDMSGVPQVWTVPAQGGWPRLITALDDAVGAVEWSPNGEWLALSVAPGGGMNSQIYLVHPDGSSLKRFTAGGKDNNWLGRWTHDGSALMMSSNLRDGAAMDSYLLQVPAGKMQPLAQNPGIGTTEDVSRDGRFALVSRMASRGSDDVYLIGTENGKAVNLTPHEGPGEFAGWFSHDGNTVYLMSNKDRDLEAFAKVKLGPDRQPGPIEVIAARDDAELVDFEVNEQGTTAVLMWNVAGKSEMSFVDLASEKVTPGPYSARRTCLRSNVFEGRQATGAGPHRCDRTRGHLDYGCRYAPIQAADFQSSRRC